MRAPVSGPIAPGPIAPIGTMPNMGTGRRGPTGPAPAPRARPRMGAGAAGLLSLGAIMGGGAIGQATGNEALGGALSGAGTGASLGMMLGPYGMLAGALLGGLAGATLMADGGIVNRPVNAIVGEAGPEAVIPLDQLMDKFDELINATKNSSGGEIVVKAVLNDREFATAIEDVVDKRVIPKE